MRHLLLILFLFLFFPNESFANSYPYEGKKPLLKKESTNAGDLHEWLRLCVGNALKNARETEKQVKRLSTPDYKLYMKAKSLERAKNYTYATGCERTPEFINRNNYFIKKLKKKVDEKLGITKSTTSTTSTTSTNGLKFCLLPSGKVSSTYSIKPDPCFILNGVIVGAMEISADDYNSVTSGKKTAAQVRQKITTGKEEINPDKSLYCVHSYEKKKIKILNASKCPKWFFITDQSSYENKYRSHKVLTSILGDNGAIRYCVNESANQKKSTKGFCGAKYFVTDKLAYETTYKNYSEIESALEFEFKNQSQFKVELYETQNYINDLLAYIEIYPSTFDILEITSFMISNKNILDGSWGDLEKEGFKLLKNYTESSKEFLAFHEQQNDIRNKDALNKITNAKNDLKKLINYFTFYLQDNVTSELAPDILDNIKLARNTLTSTDIGELINIIAQLNNYITSKDLTSNYRKFAATQKETVVTKKETKKEEKKINTTQISSKEDFKKAQSALKKLGFYNGVIDGLFGRVSIKALNAWQEQTNLTLTTTISIDLLAKLEKASNASTKEIVKKEIIVDTKTTETTMYDAKQQTAQNYILDLFEFIAINPDTFDIIQMTELISVNKPILNNKWNEVQQKDFALLKAFAATSEDFVKFHARQNDQRQKDILNEIALQNSKLKNIIGYFRYYLKNNFASEIALSVIKNIKFAETSLEDQNLGALNNANAELETFIANNNLTKDYTKYINSLSSKGQEQSAITASSIDAIDLVNFDFIKNADDSDFITLVNLSGKAPNALLNLEGKVVFEKDIAYSCFYQTKEIKNDLKYYLYDKVANQKFLAFDQGFVCNQNNLLNYDLIFFEKDALLREEKSYVSTLAAAIGSDQLQLFSTITKKEYEKDFLKRDMLVEQITDDVLNEARLGYGSLIIANDNTTLCTDVDSSLGQISILNLLGNEFTRMGYGKSVNDIDFNNTEDTFTNVQRGNCGFIYANETSLYNLMTAFESSKTEYGVVPIWLSKKQVANEQERQENKEKGLLIDLQKKKEQIEKEKKLEQERLKADGVLKAQEQQALRDRNRNVVEAHTELMENEIKLLLNKDTFKDTWLYESYPDLGKLMEKKFKEKWELDQSNVTINDYGLSDYKGRKIATYITDVNFRLKNNDLGEYESICVRLAIIDDREFNRWREPEASICKTNDDINLTEEELYEKYKNSFDIYKKRLNFQSAWIIE